MQDVDILTESLILFQVVDTGVNNNSPDPAFKSSLVLESVNLRKHFYETFLKHILSIFPVMGKAKTNCQHFGTISVI